MCIEQIAVSCGMQDFLTVLSKLYNRYNLLYVSVVCLKCIFTFIRGAADLDPFFHFSKNPKTHRCRRPTGDQEVAGSTPAEVGNILSWRLIMK